MQIDDNEFAKLEDFKYKLMVIENRSNHPSPMTVDDLMPRVDIREYERCLSSAVQSIQYKLELRDLQGLILDIEKDLTIRADNDENGNRVINISDSILKRIKRSTSGFK